MMRIAVLVVAAGTAAIMVAGAIFGPTRLAILAGGFAATGIARPLFEMPMQAWLTTQVPSAQRGRAIGLAELGWALSLAITVPAAGLLIGLGGWRYAFIVILVCCAAGIAAIHALVKPAIHRTVSGAAGGTDLWDEALPGFPPADSRKAARSAVVLCVATSSTVAAGELILVTHGSWMGQTFGLSTEKIGLITVVIVLAELTGSGLVAAIGDRLDLRRTAVGALFSSVVAALLLGRVEDTATAIIVLGIWFVTFEASIVTLVALAATAGVGRTARVRLDDGRHSRGERRGRRDFTSALRRQRHRHIGNRGCRAEPRRSQRTRVRHPLNARSSVDRERNMIRS